MDNIPLRGSSGTIFTKQNGTLLSNMYANLSPNLILMEFGGNTVRETYVEPKYGNIKEELLASNLITAKLLRERIVEKGDRFMDSKAVKAKKAWTMWSEYDVDDPYHFDIDSSPHI